MLCVLAATATLTACAGAGPRETPSERQWVDDGVRLVDDLRNDVVLSSAGGVDTTTARRALRSDSDLFALVVAYTAFGSCSAMLRDVGPPGPRLRDAADAIAAACVRFERSSALFTRAVSTSSPAELVAAHRAASLGYPFLVRARARLDALRRSGGSR